jgi:hypothetical protein
MHKIIYINIFMNYLTQYYKNKSVLLEQELNYYQNLLNEVVAQTQDSDTAIISTNPVNQAEMLGIGRWLDDLFRPKPRDPVVPRRPRPGVDDIPSVPGKRPLYPHGFNQPRPGKIPSHAPSGPAYPKDPRLVHPNGTPIGREGGGVFSIGNTYFYRSADGTIYVWSPSGGVWVPSNPAVHPWQ